MRILYNVLCLGLLLGLLSAGPTSADEGAAAQGKEHVSTDERELTQPSPEGVCGGVYQEYEERSENCTTCWDYNNHTWGKKVNLYMRSCYYGPPSCGGCGGWQYIGWSCEEC